MAAIAKTERFSKMRRMGRMRLVVFAKLGFSTNVGQTHTVPYFATLVQKECIKIKQVSWGPLGQISPTHLDLHRKQVATDASELTLASSVFF